jgi:hypothetical protein
VCVDKDHRDRGVLCAIKTRHFNAPGKVIAIIAAINVQVHRRLFGDDAESAICPPGVRKCVFSAYVGLGVDGDAVFQVIRDQRKLATRF